jgi:putative component of membrane protein insertase Oxa1/YidC/SpoIIIJ protein YidD
MTAWFLLSRVRRDFRAVIAISSGKTCEYSQSCHCFMTKDLRYVDFCASLTIAIIRIKLP